MNRRSLDEVFERPLTRRAILQRGGALGLGTLLAAGSLNLAGAHSASTSALNNYPEVMITATNYSFKLPKTIPGGWTRLTLRNQGTEAHHAMFLRLNEGVTADAALAAAKQDPNTVFTKMTSVGGPASINSGQQTSVIANLEPGNYLVVCAIPGADGMPHYAMGMFAPLEVTAAAKTGAAPVADATVKLVDFGFGAMPMDVTAGPHVWEIANVGSQLHEMAICQIAPGLTFEQVQAMLAAETDPSATPAAGATTSSAETGPPPIVALAGVAPISPGQTNWSVLDLAAGNYFSICFIPDAKTGAPHAALGMVMPFTVR